MRWGFGEGRKGLRKVGGLDEASEGKTGASECMHVYYVCVCAWEHVDVVQRTGLLLSRDMRAPGRFSSTIIWVVLSAIS